jgi:hypothetical protein
MTEMNCLTILDIVFGVLARKLIILHARLSNWNPSVFVHDCWGKPMLCLIKAVTLSIFLSDIEL